MLVCLSLAPLSATAVHAKPPVADTQESDIPKAALLAAAELVPMLSQSEPPLVLQVGSHVMYAQAHIPGSEYTGGAATPEGIDNLRKRVADVPSKRVIVLYCGCCPWGRCPNIRPAYHLLQTLGFTNVKVLYLPQNFGEDWVAKGFPVARGR